MDLDKIKKTKIKKTKFISARVTASNFRWYKGKKIVLNKLIDELRKDE